MERQNQQLSKRCDLVAVLYSRRRPKRGSWKKPQWWYPDKAADRGMALLVDGAIPSAQRNFEDALDLDPEHAKARSGLAQIALAKWESTIGGTLPPHQRAAYLRYVREAASVEELKARSRQRLDVFPAADSVGVLVEEASSPPAPCRFPASDS